MPTLMCLRRGEEFYAGPHPSSLHPATDLARLTVALGCRVDQFFKIG
jgi:hypothetical protein